MRLAATLAAAALALGGCAGAGGGRAVTDAMSLLGTDAARAVRLRGGGAAFALDEAALRLRMGQLPRGTCRMLGPWLACHPGGRAAEAVALRADGLRCVHRAAGGTPVTGVPRRGPRAAWAQAAGPVGDVRALVAACEALA
jgi:hypothetical protein